MTIAFVSGSKFSGSQNGGASGVFDSTGATSILVFTGAYQGTGSGSLGTPSDNKGNTYTLRTSLKTSPTGFELQLWECLTATTGSGHIVTQTGSNSFNSFCVQAFSGIASFGASLTHMATAGATSIQPRSLTPSANGAVLLSGLVLGTAPTSLAIDSGYTLTAQNSAASSVTEGSAMAYLIQTTAAAANPTWSGFTAVVECAALGAYYLTSGGGGSNFNFPPFQRSAA